MRLRRLINLVLATVVTAGLAVAPWAATPAAAGQAHAAAMTDMSMSADMPCCPDQQQKAPTCDDCPLVALCVLQMAQIDRAGTATLIHPPVHIVLLGRDDVARDGPAHPPPDHPPRPLV